MQARAATTAEADRASFQQVCDVCQRTYYSENSYRNHISSQKHKAKEAASRRRHEGVADDEVKSVMSSTFSLGDPLPAEDEVGSDAEGEFNEVVEGLQKTTLKDRPEIVSPIKRPLNPNPLAEGELRDDHPASAAATEDKSTTSTTVPNVTLKSCLFCSYESPTVPLNVVHMERIHSMFIPERQYLVDLDGLIGALQQRIYEFHECLYCGKFRSTAQAVQTHMRDKGHCRVPFSSEEEQLEIGEYYDFRSTYSDDDEESEEESCDGDKQNGGAKLGARRSTTAVNEDGDEVMNEEDGWETDSSASSCNSDDLTAIPVDHHIHQYDRLDRNSHHASHHQRDGWHSHAHKHRAIFYDDTELHLPSGRSVGHRSLAKYYRQNLHSHPSPQERERLAIEAAENADDAMDVDEDSGNQVANRQDRRGNGALITRANGGKGMLGVTDQKKKEVQRKEDRTRKQEQVAQSRKQWAINKQANHQKYYNYQIL